MATLLSRLSIRRPRPIERFLQIVLDRTGILMEATSVSEWAGFADRPSEQSRLGWHELKNGELLQQAEEAGYDLLLTSDKNIRHQQNLSGRKIAIVVLGNQQWPDVKLHLDRILEAVNAAHPGSYSEVEIPHKD